MAEGTQLAKAYVQILPSMDGFQNKLEKEMGGSSESAGKSSGSSFGGAFSAAAKATAKAGIAAVTAAGAGVVALTKSAVSAYGEYEQLVGGVNKLFGDASKQLMGYAEEAYKTSGLSANEYMEQATSFSAAMIKSLGGDTKKAAELTDVAMQAMADNVNTFGTSIESVQAAFQGFSKENYTMLDNLKLGYGGTAQGMYQLLSDAAAINDEFARTAQFSMDEKGHLEANFSDIVKAVDIIQEKQGIAGATANEAASTLQGSFAMTKSAWQNLVTGLASPDADLGKLVTNFTESAQFALKNLLPIVKRGLQGVGEMVTELLPEVFKMIPDLLDDILPDLLDTIDVTITEVFPVLIEVLAKNLPKLLTTVAKAGKTIVKSLFTAIDKELSGNKIYDTLKNGLSKLLPVFEEVGGSLMESGKKIFESLTELLGKIDFDKIFDSIAGAAETIAPVIEDIGEAAVWLFDNAISPFIEWAANNVIPTAIDALSAAFRILKKAIEGVKPIISAIWDNFLKPLAEWTGDAVVIALEAVTGALESIADEFEELDWDGYWADFDNFAENWKTGADSIGQALLDNSKDIEAFFNASEFGTGWNDFWQGVGGAVSDAVDWIAERFDDWKTGAADIEEALENFGGKVSDFVDIWVAGWQNIGDKVADIVDAVKKDWKTGEENLEKFGEKINDFVTNWKEKWEAVGEKVADAVGVIKEKWETLSDFASKAYTWGKDLITSFIQGIKDSFWELESTMESFGEMIYDYIHFSEPDKGALSDFETYAPDMVQSFAKGIRDNTHYIEDEMQSLSSVMKNGLNTPAYTPSSATQSPSVASSAQGGTVTLRLTDNANRVIAEGTAGILDIINGNSVALSERGLASV